MQHFVSTSGGAASSPRHHDACGVNWQTEPGPHFSGNFWWATPRYLVDASQQRSARQPFDPEAVDRHEPAPRRCLHESGVDHYATPYPPERYRARRRR